MTSHIIAQWTGQGLSQYYKIYSQYVVFAVVFTIIIEKPRPNTEHHVVNSVDKKLRSSAADSDSECTATAKRERWGRQQTEGGENIYE